MATRRKIRYETKNHKVDGNHYDGDSKINSHRNTKSITNHVNHHTDSTRPTLSSSWWPFILHQTIECWIHQVGNFVGVLDGTSVGALVGKKVGVVVGALVGDVVGMNVGAVVAATNTVVGIVTIITNRIMKDDVDRSRILEWQC